jgi:hypothetical protein
MKYWTIDKVEAPQEWIVQTSKSPPIPFNIFMNVKYHHVKLASDEATLISKTLNPKPY